MQLFSLWFVGIFVRKERERDQLLWKALRFSLPFFAALWRHIILWAECSMLFDTKTSDKVDAMFAGPTVDVDLPSFSLSLSAYSQKLFHSPGGGCEMPLSNGFPSAICVEHIFFTPSVFGYIHSDRHTSTAHGIWLKVIENTLMRLSLPTNRKTCAAATTTECLPRIIISWMTVGRCTAYGGTVVRAHNTVWDMMMRPVECEPRMSCKWLCECDRQA